MRAATAVLPAALAAAAVLLLALLAAGASAEDAGRKTPTPRNIRNTWTAAVEKADEISAIVGDAFPGNEEGYDKLLSSLQNAMEGGLYRVVLADADTGKIVMDTGSDFEPGNTPGREWATPAKNSFSDFQAGTVAPRRPVGFDWTVDWPALGADPYAYSRLRETEDGEATAVARLGLASGRGVVIVSVVPVLPPPPPAAFGVESVCPPCVCDC